MKYFLASIVPFAFLLAIFNVTASSTPVLNKALIQQKLMEGVRESPFVQLGDGTMWKYVGTPVVSVSGFHVSISFNVEPVTR